MIVESLTVTAEAAGSSPVVPAIPFKSQVISKKPSRAQIAPLMPNSSVYVDALSLTINRRAALPARRIGISLQELTDYNRQRRAGNDVVVSRAGQDCQLRRRPHRSV